MPRTPETYVPDATGEPAAYKARLLELASDGDPVETMAAAPGRARALVEGLDTPLVDQRPEPGEWSVAEIVGHLFDVDIVYGFRWRLVATEEAPDYPGYDEKRFTFLPRPPFAECLEAWSGLRRANVVLVAELRGDGWQRRGRHGEQGDETFEEMVQKVAGHDVAHLNQLQRTVEEVTRS